MRRRAATLIAIAMLGPADRAFAELRASYLYPLADGGNPLSFGWASLSWDRNASELYVVDSGHGMVGVFNDNGMAVHSFGDARGFGLVAAVAVLETGEPLVLAVKGESFSLVRCNFRGEQVDRLELRGFPASFSNGFAPNALQVAAGQIYLADKRSMRVAVLTPDGEFVTAYDLARILGIAGGRQAEAEIRGFSVDRGGNLLFTVAALFQAFVVSPEGRVRAFGMKGSVPGRFNVAGGIASDDDGHLFVTDTLRCVVMVFDQESLRFLAEFAGCGSSGPGLISPLDLVVGNGRVYVTQSRGPVKVFAVEFQ